MMMPFMIITLIARALGEVARALGEVVSSVADALSRAFQPGQAGDRLKNLAAGRIDALSRRERRSIYYVILALGIVLLLSPFSRLAAPASIFLSFLVLALSSRRLSLPEGWRLLTLAVSSFLLLVNLVGWLGWWGALFASLVVVGAARSLGQVVAKKEQSRERKEEVKPAEYPQEEVRQKEKPVREAEPEPEVCCGTATEAEPDIKEAAEKAIAAASTAVENARSFGCAVAEAETLLTQARSAPERSDFALAKELAEKAGRTADQLREQSRPRIVLKMAETALRFQEWQEMELTVANQGSAHARDISCLFSSQVIVQGMEDIALLPPGKEQKINLELRPREAGDLQVRAELSYKDMEDREFQEVAMFPLKVREKIEMPSPEIVQALPGYVFLGKIGSGGSAEVFRACKGDGMEVALKIPRLSLSETFSPREFLKEAELWSKLNHPHIVKVYEYGVKPIPWITLEYMKGGSLRRKMGHLSPRESLRIGVRMAETLYYAHYKGVIHRDIKPENILFDLENVPKLTDWGLGKVMLETSLSISGFKGTLAYSAPEQLSSDLGEPDHLTDIYQLGAVLYEMLTGQLACGGEIGKILNREAIPPSQVNAQVPPELDRVVLKALAKRKEQRFRDISRLGEELERIERTLP